MSGSLEEFYLFRQIARIARLSAYERMLDWMFEMRDRLAVACLVADDSFPMPITQEGLADALGLTSVHVNRTLQLMRREGLVELRGGMAQLIDPQRLMSLINYRPASVTAVGPVERPGSADQLRNRPQCLAEHLRHSQKFSPSAAGTFRARPPA